MEGITYIFQTPCGVITARHDDLLTAMQLLDRVVTAHRNYDPKSMEESVAAARVFIDNLKTY